MLLRPVAPQRHVVAVKRAIVKAVTVQTALAPIATVKTARARTANAAATASAVERKTLN